MFSNHYMVAYMRGSDTMQCAAVSSIYGSLACMCLCLICMYSGGACMFSNHSMVEYVRESDTMQCDAISSIYGNLFFPSCWLFG